MSRWPLGRALGVLACAVAAVVVYGRIPDASLALGGTSLELLAPRRLAMLCLLPTLALGAIGSLTDQGKVQRGLSLLLRAALLAALVLSLCEPVQQTPGRRVSLVVAVDVSDSIDDAALKQAAATVEALRGAAGDHDLQLLTFDARAARVALPHAGEPLPPLRRHGRGDAHGPAPGADSDLAAALRFSYGLFPPGHLRRVLMLSDGRQTRGDLLAESERARELGVALHTRTLTDAAPAEVAIESVQLPEAPGVGTTFDVVVHLYATRATDATLRLYRDGALDGPGAVRTLSLQPGHSEERFQSVSRVAGVLRYRAVLQPEGADHFTENNQAQAETRVVGSPRVLVIDPDPTQMAPLGRALGHADIDVEIRSPAGIPRSLSELAGFDFVILSDTPQARVSRAQMLLLLGYVRELGGGFMMAGGEQSFGPGGFADTPLGRLLPVRLDAQRRLDEPSLALALVIDCSGSMAGQKMELAKEAARATARLLGEDDSLTVIGFSGQPERIVRLQRARNAHKIQHNIGRLMARGGTAIFPGLDMAYQDLLVARARLKHVILLTDGQTQEEGIPELVQQMQADAVTVSTVGLGVDVNRSLLQTAANLGGGRAHFTDDPHNVPRIFMRETSTIGRSSAVEELFRPQVVERADFMAGLPMAAMPYLRGHVATQARPHPAQVLLQSDLGEPVLARWHVGLGWALAWTPDLKSRWAPDLLRWSSFPRFIGQLVREHMRADRGRSFPMRAIRSSDGTVVEVDATDADDRFVTDLESELTVQGPAPDERRSLPMRQVAPAIYRTRLPPGAPGTLRMHATHRRGGAVVATSKATLSIPYPREYAVAEPAPDVLAVAAGRTGGGQAESPTDLWLPGNERLLTGEPLWPRLVMAALVIFFVDLLLRRVRLGAGRGPAGPESTG